MHLYRLFALSLWIAGCSPLLAPRLASPPHPRPSHLDVTLGENLESSSYPTVALLKFDYKGQPYTFCSGVLVSQQEILTAAHCSLDKNNQSYSPPEVRVALGQSKPDSPGTRLEMVQDINVHAQFDRRKLLPDAEGLLRPDATYDVAIWTLAAPAAPSFMPPPLLEAETLTQVFVDHRALILMGFGLSSVWDTMNQAQLRTAVTFFQKEAVVTLQKKVMVDGRPLKKNYSYTIQGQGEFEFYAGGEGLPDTCKGDSGGPVFVRDTGGRSWLLGLTSRGDVSCSKGGIYTLLTSHLDWLRAHISQLEVGSPSL